MKLIGLMLARNEQWIIEASIRAAMQWVDHLIVIDHDSTDDTRAIADRLRDEYGRITVIAWTGCPDWVEMDMRQTMLSHARRMDATHIAVIDADEIVTLNLRRHIRRWFDQLQQGEALMLPMLRIYDGLDDYDTSHEEWISVGFVSDYSGDWIARKGYHHHARMPEKVRNNRLQRINRHIDGGVMHLQWASPLRVTAKHVWYRMMEKLRYDRPVSELNALYDQSIMGDPVLADCLPGWWGPERDLIRVDDEPWHLEACRTMLLEHGPEQFAGLDLKGLIDVR